MFTRTAAYDEFAIRNYLVNQSQSAQDHFDMDSVSGFPSALHIESKKANNLRYGENPHQQAALYGDFQVILINCK